MGSPIDALVNRRERLLVVQRTGWGKSSVYFIATRILRDRVRGPTLIVSPLLALMRNQIEAADRLENRALSINSTNRQVWPDLRRAVLDDEAGAVLISAERLANDDLVEDVLLPIAGTTGLLVVDEAHCRVRAGFEQREGGTGMAVARRPVQRGIPVPACRARFGPGSNVTADPFRIPALGRVVQQRQEGPERPFRGAIRRRP